MTKGIPNKRYTSKFKKLFVETTQKEKLSCREAARQFGDYDERKFRSMERFRQKLIEDLNYYNNRRIKEKLKGLPPVICRQQALFFA